MTHYNSFKNTSFVLSQYTWVLRLHLPNLLLLLLLLLYFHLPLVRSSPSTSRYTFASSPAFVPFGPFSASSSAAAASYSTKYLEIFSFYLQSADVGFVLGFFFFSLTIKLVHNRNLVE